MIFRRMGRGREDPPEAFENETESCPEQVSGSRTGVLKGVRSGYESVLKVYGIRTDTERTVRSWRESFPELEKDERGRGMKRAIMGGAVAVSVLAVMQGQPPRVCICLSLMATASLVGYDFCYMLSRILADYSRYLITFALLAWAVFVLKPIRETLIMAGVISASSVLMVIFLNIRWLSAQVYKRCPTVKRMLAKDLPDDLEKIWLTGRRMCRTFAWEIGEPLNVIEGQLVKGCFLMGYSVGSTISAQTIETNAKLADESVQLRARVAVLEEELDENAEFIENREDHEAELAGVREVLRSTKAELAAVSTSARESLIKSIDQEETIARQADDIARKDARIMELESELVEAREIIKEMTPASITPMNIESEKDRVARILKESFDNNMSIRQAAQAAGCSKFKAEAFAKEYKAAAEA